jgi:hypothetical protein
VAIFHVRFFNPQTKMLHSSAVVDVAHPADAVKAATAQLADAPDGHLLSSYDVGITDTNGAGVVGLEKAMSVAQIQTRMEELQRQLSALTGTGGQTEAQAAAVSSTIPGVNQAVAAPVAQNPAAVQPGAFTPPTGGPVPTEVVQTADNTVNGGLFTQADVDAQIAAALANAAKPAMQG